VSATMGNNAYDCTARKCGKSRVYRHADDGVTPMFDRCVCGGQMVSRMYRDIPNVTPTHEWYKPSDAELATYSEGTRAHVKNGGLLPRPID